MDMIERELLDPRYVPERLLEHYSFTEAYVAKLGFLRLELTGSHIKPLDGDDTPGTIELFIDELYVKLSASPHIMSIEPKKEQLLQEYDQGVFGITVWPNQGALSLGQFLKLRVVMPERRRKELGIFSWSWNPEEFTIYFDGAMFCVHAPTPTVSVPTDLGQIARDFFKETVSSSEIWNYVDGIGPTPIHPDVYLVVTQNLKDNEDSTLLLPLIKTYRDDICIFVPGGSALEDMTDPLLRDMHFGLDAFYRQRLANADLRNEIDELENMNEKLSALVAQYFELPVYKRLFSSVPRNIRKLVAKMHMSLQQVSASIILTRRSREEALKDIHDTAILKGVENYFDERMELGEEIDQGAQMSIMNFAADETNNFDITRATVVAALAGALIGGLITASTQFLVK